MVYIHRRRLIPKIGMFAAKYKTIVTRFRWFCYKRQKKYKIIYTLQIKIKFLKYLGSRSRICHSVPIPI